MHLSPDSSQVIKTGQKNTLDPIYKSITRNRIFPPNYLQIKYNIFLPSTFVAPPSSTYRTLRILETFRPPSAASLSRRDNWISLSSTRGRLVLRRSAARCWMKMVSAEFCRRPRKILILRVDPSPCCVGGPSHFLQVLQTPKDKLIFVSTD